MRIAIDATSVPERPAGAGTYAIELVRAMAQRDPHDGYALFARGAIFDDAVAGRRNWRIERVRARTRASRTFWEQYALPRACARLGIDVLHSTHHSLPLRPMHARRVVTVHDVTFFRLPERYPAARRLYMQAMTRAAARIADAIIVPSQAVRDDVVRTLGVPAEKLSVAYEAPGERFRPLDPAQATEVARRYGVEGPFVLSVGSREPGKNRARLIRAMAALRLRGVDLPLLIVGQQAWGSDEEAAAARDAGIADRVLFAGYVPAGDLPALYSAATVFAFPSLYEGFGLPVLEAMACGTPVVTSNVSATGEVAGDAALLVDPHSVDEITDALARVLTSDALRRDLSARGLARAADFSWRRAADETYAVYRRVFDATGGIGTAAAHSPAPSP